MGAWTGRVLEIVCYMHGKSIVTKLAFLYIIEIFCLEGAIQRSTTVI